LIHLLFQIDALNLQTILIPADHLISWFFYK
jgi:hypothetical protein